jgi:hypothetical protein
MRHRLGIGAVVGQVVDDYQSCSTDAHNVVFSLATRRCEEP